MTPVKKNQTVNQILSWLSFAGVITMMVVFLYSNFQTQAQAAVQDQSFSERYKDIKEALTEIKVELREIRKEQRRRQ